jgi:hypothetical protein
MEKVDLVEACRLLAARLVKANDRIDDLEQALHRIAQWSKAYPLTVFPEPDLKKARELLEAGGLTLDSISAHCMRHVVEGVGRIAREALESGHGETED